ncbi:hypothetical protein LKMONMHP_4321 [Methylobacterium organophilum]|uniref:DegT/DnrJ/EryC1/StrS aminotransferase n=1 Tax=Methylobacterium organophilum TaxID=410 RepID=A0ABQ4TH10_METOR|nr:hypothetical protein LKMONMHP_4321 [Methylobacterium organophilum]
MTARALETIAANFLPLTKPDAPRLSAYVEELREIEKSCWLSNYGPVNTRLEAAMLDRFFGGVGACTTVCNATNGLMLALMLAAERASAGARYVVMPAFTFAAAAHAVLWAGLTPLLIDVDPSDWCACRLAEEEALEAHRGRVAALMPYATFGTCIDLSRYDRLAREHGVSVVVDAAPSLGSLDPLGQTFGTGSPHMIVFSMHGTKPFGVGEGGLIYSADSDTIDTLRRMANFGFDNGRSAVMPGMNAKMSEVAALGALVRLKDFEERAQHREQLLAAYLKELPDIATQQTRGQRVVYQFMPLLLPPGLAASRAEIQAEMTRMGIGTGSYFSPHIGQQPYFRTRCVSDALPVADTLSAHVLSLPLSDFLTVEDVARICAAFREACGAPVEERVA